MTQSPITLKDDLLEHVMPITWNEVWEFWRTNEEREEHWTLYWKEKGYASWAHWRAEEMLRRFPLGALQWHFYNIAVPLVSVRQFRGGPFKGWIERFYKGRLFPTFEELANDRDGIATYRELRGKAVDMPEESTVTGVAVDGSVLIMEGMHRCSTIALAAKEAPVMMAEESNDDTPEEVAEKSILTIKGPDGGEIRKEFILHLALAQWPKGMPLKPAY